MLTTIIFSEFSTHDLIHTDEAQDGRILELARKGTFFIKKVPTRNYRLRQIHEI